ncbi:MAG: NADH-quinone oxidoreductase subunit J [Deltaproteobacteria bacterium]|nr:NADH-quinone oxidoreductase subunit J [Deltaproteobacteria bacterium]TLN00794.1 MAG: NADH-quinone oxidoreductase subunit J [bacterium]
MTFSSAGNYSLVTTLIFFGFVAVTLGGALIAALSRQMVRSVCGLAVSSLGLAGLYYLLASPFLALMHILIYVGAVCVVLMFALMLSEPQEQRRSKRGEALIAIGGLLIAGLFSVVLILLISATRWVPPAQQSGYSVQDLGRALLTRYGFAFELISVVLLLAILGALVIARSGRGSES